tara:strand:+ start:579 stop:755 length:177 start_codon:yes stop_codon:yes gene_type:complete
MDYEVTSHRLSGYKFGDIIREADLGNLTTDLAFLVDSGHLSPLKPKKSAKTINTEQKD